MNNLQLACLHTSLSGLASHAEDMRRSGDPYARGWIALSDWLNRSDLSVRVMEDTIANAGRPQLSFPWPWYDTHDNTQRGRWADGAAFHRSGNALPHPVFVRLKGHTGKYYDCNLKCYDTTEDAMTAAAVAWTEAIAKGKI
ncbi:hypothetical protein AYO40_01240 [Planctomycetaceae bacterium SCGC AG-212-D15]|nr:hypothetical protein AYO40_01240 [Planctomycetaceae bacterium SCGC AG-212-D15]